MKGRMMRQWMIVMGSVALLGGCNTPPIGFPGTTPTRIAIDQSEFDVRIKGDRAHALRLNREFAPNIGFVASRAAQAFRHVSRCQFKRRSSAGVPMLITAVSYSPSSGLVQSNLIG